MKHLSNDSVGWHEFIVVWDDSLMVPGCSMAGGGHVGSQWLKWVGDTFLSWEVEMDGCGYSEVIANANDGDYWGFFSTRQKGITRGSSWIRWTTQTKESNKRDESTGLEVIENSTDWNNLIHTSCETYSAAFFGCILRYFIWITMNNHGEGTNKL